MVRVAEDHDDIVGDPNLHPAAGEIGPQDTAHRIMGELVYAPAWAGTCASSGPAQHRRRPGPPTHDPHPPDAPTSTPSTFGTPVRQSHETAQPAGRSAQHGVPRMPSERAHRKRYQTVTQPALPDRRAFPSTGSALNPSQLRRVKGLPGVAQPTRPRPPTPTSRRRSSDTHNHNTTRRPQRTPTVLKRVSMVVPTVLLTEADEARGAGRRDHHPQRRARLHHLVPLRRPQQASGVDHGHQVSAGARTAGRVSRTPRRSGTAPPPRSTTRSRGASGCMSAVRSPSRGR